MQVDAPASALQKIDHTILDHVVPQGEEGTRAAIDDECIRASEEFLHQLIESAGINPTVGEELKMPDIERLVLAQRLVDRISINAPAHDLLAPQVLSQQGGNETLPDSTFPLQNQ